MSFLEVKGIRYENEQGLVLDSVYFHQDKGLKIAIGGQTGSGKSTLLKAIGGLIQPSGGEVLFLGKRVLGAFEKLIPGHPLIGYLSQHFELRPNYRVLEFMEIARKIPEGEAARIYELCRITHLLQRKTDQLSGGERQRIALARVLITGPVLLLLDEPFSNLDLIQKTSLKEVIDEISTALDLSFILVSHDPGELLGWADHILLLHEGRLIQEGPPLTVYRQPVNEIAAGLLGPYALMNGTWSGADNEQQRKRANAGKLLVRPETFVLDNQKGTLKARVVSMQFMGGYYDVQVQVENTILPLRVLHQPPAAGDEVKLTPHGQLWYL
jgi:iron(III) transport system ATP-binding protein